VKIEITETGEIKELKIIDPENGENYIRNFISKVTNKTLEYANDDAVYSLKSDEDYHIWNELVKKHQKVNFRIHDLKKEHGDERVNKVLNKIGKWEARAIKVKAWPDAVQNALDKEFSYRSDNQDI
jgi:hypothetical protein